MLTSVDKAIVAFIITALATLNTKYGFHFDVGENTSAVLNSLIDAALSGVVGCVFVWAFPNKKA